MIEKKFPRQVVNANSEAFESSCSSTAATALLNCANYSRRPSKLQARARFRSLITAAVIGKPIEAAWNLAVACSLWLKRKKLFYDQYVRVLARITCHLQVDEKPQQV